MGKRFHKSYPFIKSSMLLILRMEQCGGKYFAVDERRLILLNKFSDGNPEKTIETFGILQHEKVTYARHYHHVDPIIFH